ncbi:MAG TPA: DUF1344 domain-containing protein [Pararhizobium sp.]|uniref:DUF1344 domain-containing protein n=1 Tax=Pararhizobium sp. TaxID=1977563 RepID=UPI002CEBB3FB|nr:DUF1344 domain-containing protein [Pararhizobium sp.]HTO33014.1 DUF1344 domain-containing protein [Pararhizobium sp.]
MRALLTSLTLISAISLSSAAFAASTTTGTVRAFDAKALTLTLKDGTRYMLPASFKDPGIKVGEKVKVAYDMIGKKHQATAVTLAQ